MKLSQANLSFTASDDGDDDDAAEELRNYVAGLREHAGSLCEQLQEQVAVQRAASRAIKAKKEPYVADDDDSWRSRAMRAEKEAMKSRQRAVDAEFRVAALESAVPAQKPGTPGQRELKLEDLLVMFKRMGVKMIVSSEDDELDKLMEDVLDPLNKLAKSNAAQRKSDEQELSGSPHAPFTKLMQCVRDDIDKALTKLTEQHTWEMAQRKAEVVDAQIMTEEILADDPAKLEGGGLREAGFGEMPGQVPEEGVKIKPLQGKHKLVSQADRNASITTWEPELCAVWESLPAEIEHSSGADPDPKHCCATLPETSRWRLFWDIICVTIVAYDCGITPLHVLGLPNNVIYNGMAWGKPVFWLLDIAFSFMSGYVHDGVDELRMKHIACRYIRTWFGVDVVLLALEIVTLIMLTHGTFNLVEFEDGQHGARRLHGWHAGSPTVRKDTVLYAIRCLLVLRLAKMYCKMNRRLGWRIKSQATRIKLGVANTVGLILLCCHIAACGFYGIGIIYEADDDSWVETNLASKSLGVKYVLSLQWSLAQFTLGTTGVHPGTFGEASYAAGVTLVAASLLLVLFARVVTAILDLASTSEGKRSKEMSTLMEYLLQCRAPPALRSRIWTTTLERSHHPETVGRRIHEDEVPILACLPHRLQDELRSVAFSPTLTTHPLFRELEFGLGGAQGEGNRLANKLHGAISEVGLRAGQVLFVDGQVAESMYFTARGELSYSTTIVDTTATKKMKPGPWFSEPALWIYWEHRGEMTAATYAELFALNAHRFQDIMKQELPEAALCWQYAKAFATYADESKLKLTDIFVDQDALDKLVHKASKGDVDKIGGSSERIGESSKQADDDQPVHVLVKGEDEPVPLLADPSSVQRDEYDDFCRNGFENRHQELP